MADEAIDTTEVGPKEELRHQAEEVLRQKGFNPDQIQATFTILAQMDEAHAAMRSSPLVTEGELTVTDHGVQTSQGRGVVAPSGEWFLHQLVRDQPNRTLDSYLKDEGPRGMVHHLEDQLALTYAAALDFNLLPEDSPLREKAERYCLYHQASSHLEKAGFNPTQVTDALKLMGLMDAIHNEMEASPPVAEGQYQLTDHNLTGPDDQMYLAYSGRFHVQHIVNGAPEFTSWVESGGPDAFLNSLQDDLRQTYYAATKLGLLGEDTPLYEEVKPYLPQGESKDSP